MEMTRKETAQKLFGFKYLLSLENVYINPEEQEILETAIEYLFKDHLENRKPCHVCGGENSLTVMYDKNIRGGKENHVLFTVTCELSCTFCPNCGRRLPHATT